MNKKSMVALMVLVLAVMLMSACKEKIKYGDKEGIATGNIDLTQEEPQIELDNILAETGDIIDYTSQLEITGAEDLDNYQVSVNSTEVDTENPGTYTVTYSITSGEKTYTEQVKVTIRDNESKATTVASSENSTSAAPVDTSSDSNEHESVPKSNQVGEGNKTDYDVTLLSGEKVKVTCNTSKYVVSTHTDISTITRGGSKYEVQQLIITYNTGLEQVLETVERKIS